MNGEGLLAGLLARWPAEELRRVQGEVWRRLALHVDGLAALSTWELLERHGILERLAAGAVPSDLARAFAVAGPGPAHQGCLRIALRSLFNQGWAAPPAPDRAGDEIWQLTAAGRDFLAVAAATRAAPTLLAAAVWAVAPGEPAPDLATALEAALELAAQNYGLPAGAPERFRRHCDGPLAAAIATALVARGWPLEEPRLTLPERCRKLLGAWLVGEGWTGPDGRPQPTAAVVALLASHYWYPLSYLPLLRGLEGLFFGDPGQLVGRGAGGEESHVDRELDIRFSGQVFEGPVRQPFLDRVRAAFAKPLAEQPEALVDVGAGDGTLLRETWEMVRAETPRGRALGEGPLLAVAVEPSSVARRRGATTLAAAGIPHRVLEGDVGSPDELAARLAAIGVDPGNCLYLCKSVFHNRSFVTPRDEGRPPLPCSTGGDFLGDRGEPLDPRQVEQSLVELFASWRPFWRRHGMVAIEAHTVPPGQAARLQGRSPLTALELLHGYSRQLLLEPEVHRAAAAAAGLVSLGRADIGRASVGYVALTVDHWLAPG